MLTVGLVRADAGDTLNFFVGASVTHDDNLFRLPGDANPQLVLGKPTKSDQVHLTYVGMKLDKSYSQQRFQVDATANNQRYQTFNQLDFNALDYRALWMWHFTPRLTGNLSADSKQTQSNFADTRDFRARQSTVTSENRRFDADWWLHGSWHLTGGVAQFNYRDSQSLRVDDSYSQHSTDAGVRYVAESGSSLALLGRQTHGSYDQRQINLASLTDNEYDQSDIELRMSWAISGKSSLDGRITHLERNFPNVARRDYSGTAGRLDYTLTPTGKFQMKLSAVRKIVSDQVLTSSYYVDDSIAFAPVWQISAKTALRLNLVSSQREFLGGAVVALPVARRDRTQSAQLGFDWSPIRAVSLSVNLLHDQRNSNYPDLFDYKATVSNIAAQISF